MGNGGKQRGLTVTNNVDCNEPLLNGPPTTIELQAPQAVSAAEKLQLIKPARLHEESLCMSTSG